MHGSILVIAKKKAAGPGGYFDTSSPTMAQEPMMFEMADEECEEELPSTSPMVHGDMGNRDVRDIIADLRAAAQRLEDLHGMGAEDEPSEEEPMEEEPGEEEEPEEAPKEEPKAKTKKPFPGFGPKKEMKY